MKYSIYVKKTNKKDFVRVRDIIIYNETKDSLAELQNLICKEYIKLGYEDVKVQIKSVDNIMFDTSSFTPMKLNNKSLN